jgi:hypothetical protein
MLDDFAHGRADCGANHLAIFLHETRRHAEALRFTVRAQNEHFVRCRQSDLSPFSIGEVTALQVWWGFVERTDCGLDQLRCDLAWRQV